MIKYSPVTSFLQTAEPLFPTLAGDTTGFDMKPRTELICIWLGQCAPPGPPLVLALQLPHTVELLSIRQQQRAFQH